MPGEFSNKVAVVTGGSRGIGREIAVELARAGAQTVIVSSSADNLASAAKTIASAGLAPLTITADLRTLEGCQQAFDAVRDKFQPVSHFGLLGRGHARRQLHRTARPSLDRWLWTKAFRLRAHVPAVLAAAQSRAGINRQYWGWRCTLTGCRLFNRRFSQCCYGQFFQSALSAWQA